MFTHLHLHTQFSLLDGACRLSELVSRARELGMTSLAITDHGNMYGAVDFYKECKKQGIKPIIGCEVYVAPHSRFDKDKTRDGKYSHLVLLVKNETGYKNLIKMVSQSFTEGFYFKPRIDRDLLEAHSEGLICLSACVAGEIPQYLLQRDYDSAKRSALWYNSVFGEGNYYLELQNHGLDEERVVADGIKRLADETGIPLVATNDVHYVRREDAEIQQVLICIATNHILGEDTGLEFHSDSFYLKSEQEMAELFADTPQAISNTQVIADKCSFDFEFGTTKLPYFETPDNMNHYDFFRQKCYDGLYERYGRDVPQSYIDRLEYELATVEKMGYTDYYLIVQDFVRFAKSKGIPVGPGRGSGAGSIAAYCIGITDLNPMKYDLIFERFLNPERVSMPDFDIDFCYERRGEVIDYVTKKYGADHVAQIVTFGTLQTKAALRDVGRVLGMPYARVDAIVKMIPNVFHITLDEAVKKSKELRQAMDEDPQVARLVEIARKVEGMPRNTSTHAAGVVITHDPVSSYVPLATNDDLVVTQYIMTTLEELGLLKMDFLGLRTLTVIDDCARACNVDIEHIAIDDEQVYKLFSRGQTEGIFQFESSGMKQMLMSLKPTGLEDLIAATSLYRPGPASQIDTFVHNSNNPQDITYDTPMLEPILKNTYGCMVYQEQVMQIFRELAGYSFGRADVVRRAMSKKKHDVMERERSAFVDGCAKNGIAQSVANGIFDKISDFASYAFNKSHAACYALVAYRCAYLKKYHPSQFMAALLTSVLDNSNKVARYIAECKRLGIRLAPPDINSSMKGFTASSDKVINYGLLGIKNLGNDFIEDIIRERQNGRYKDIFDFCSRLQGGKFNRRAVESLIRCGAFDNMGANRKQMLNALPVILTNIEEKYRRTMYGQVGLFDLNDDFSDSFEMPNVEEYSKSELLQMEKEMTGLYLSGHPMDRFDNYVKSAGCVRTYDVLDAGNEMSSVKDGSVVTLCGSITRISVKQTRSNNMNMAFVTLEDLYGTVEIVLFPKVFAQCSMLITQGNVIAVKGTVSIEEEKEPKILVNSVVEPKADVTAQNVEQRTKRNGLFLKFSSRRDERVRSAAEILAGYRGDFPVYYYFADEKKYEKLKKELCFSYDEEAIERLRQLLGEDNVVVRL
ncbi:DNA polymerase III subunit alpha [uncultured Eubacterium sp.]|uniref:DNA polymerase III subunit alpha n=1 Tax=uncultured Eubacterium sp. TaxID=165185 RepID=UPI0015BF146B|nr:DNA polymerase III subunit alpha [uncultured Eubacterium sp.]